MKDQKPCPTKNFLWDFLGKSFLPGSGAPALPQIMTLCPKDELSMLHKAWSARRTSTLSLSLADRTRNCHISTIHVRIACPLRIIQYNSTEFLIFLSCPQLYIVFGHEFLQHRADCLSVILMLTGSDRWGLRTRTSKWKNSHSLVLSALPFFCLNFFFAIKLEVFYLAHAYWPVRWL